MRRLYDDDLYSLHMIMNSEPEARAIYYGHKSGMMSLPSPEMPAKLLTDKTFYRIAKDTSFLCRTRWYEVSQDSTLHCIMQIGDGGESNAFIYPDPQVRYVTNPALGVDALKNETLHVDIIADDKGSTANMKMEKRIIKDHFRTLSKPEPSIFKSIKSLF